MGRGRLGVSVTAGDSVHSHWNQIKIFLTIVIARVLKVIFKVIL